MCDLTAKPQPRALTPGAPPPTRALAHLSWEGAALRVSRTASRVGNNICCRSSVEPNDPSMTVAVGFIARSIPLMAVMYVHL